MKHCHHIFMFLAATLVSVLLSSCGKDFQNDIDELNATHASLDQRVGSLETKAAKLNSQLQQLSVLTDAVEQNFYITNVTTTSKGYELTFSNGKTIELQLTPDGLLTTAPAVSMTQIGGLYYWTVNGQLLTGTDGNPIRSTVNTPIVKYDYEQQQWLISVNGGATFQNVSSYVSIFVNENVLIEIINKHVAQHSTTLFSQQILYQIVSTYIQQNYKELFNIEVLDEVVVKYVNENHTRLFSYELLEEIFEQYNYEYVTSNIKIEELVSVIVNFIKEHKEVIANSEELYEIVSTYLQVNKTTIFTEELLKEVVNKFVENNQGYINVELLTQVITNYMDMHRDVVFNTETIRTILEEYVKKYYVQVFSQSILIQIVSNYITENRTTIFNETLIQEVISHFVQNNYTTIFSQETITEIVNNYIQTNSSTVFNHDELVEVILNYFQKNYNLFVDRTVISQTINEYISTHESTIINVDIITSIINSYLESYYREVFSYDILTEIVYNYFNQNIDIISQYVSEDYDIIKSVNVDNDLCTVTLGDGQTLCLMVYENMTRLRDRIQSVVAMTSNGHFEWGDGNYVGGNISLKYLVSPDSMARIIQTKYYYGEIDLELVYTTESGDIGTLRVYEPIGNEDGTLYISANTLGNTDIKTVALHIKENYIGGTDIMTEFVPIGSGKYKPQAPWDKYFEVEDGDYMPGSIPQPTSDIELGSLSYNEYALAGGMNFISVTSSNRYKKFYVGIRGINGFWFYIPEGYSMNNNQYVYTIPLIFTPKYYENITVVIIGVTEDGRNTKEAEAYIKYIESLSGDLNVNLTFNTPKDVDLHLILPSGERIFYGNRGGNYTMPDGSTVKYGLDHDSNPACHIDNLNNESIFIPDELITAGTYTVIVNLYANCNTSYATDWSVVARYKGALVKNEIGHNPASGTYSANAGTRDMTVAMQFTISDNQINYKQPSKRFNPVRFTPIPLSDMDTMKLEELNWR